MTDKEMEQIDTIDLLYPMIDYKQDELLKWVIDGNNDRTVYQTVYSGAGGKGLPKKNIKFSNKI